MKKKNEEEEMKKKRMKKKRMKKTKICGADEVNLEELHEADIKNIPCILDFTSVNVGQEMIPDDYSYPFQI